MITCKLYGRLGNQMFQIVATIGTAIKHGVEYKIPTVTADPATFKTYFNHFPALTSQDIITGTYNEQGHQHHEIPFTDGMCLNGYFQSEKYFSHCRQQILDAFKIYCPPITHTASIHVRRGDYLNYPDKFNQISEDYLDEAIRFFCKKEINSFLVFSDDVSWCRKNINDKIYEYNCDFRFSENKSELYDMALMSGCEHHIIGNGSSFSWWGAWLNRNPDKIVIAPKKWFANEEWNTDDIYCPDWIRL
ncbi:MAG: alpha-1,2-fucosyltransferase [Nanoarchaeota archaeon]